MRLEDEVIELLGKPEGFTHVRVGKVTEREYRADVFIRFKRQECDMVEENKLTDSFFITVNATGGIIDSKPPIERKYDAVPAIIN